MRARLRLQNRRGASAIILVLMIPVIIGMVAMTVDVGRLTLERQKLTNICDACAKAGGDRPADRGQRGREWRLEPRRGDRAGLRDPERPAAGHGPLHLGRRDGRRGLRAAGLRPRRCADEFRSHLWDRQEAGQRVREGSPRGRADQRGDEVRSARRGQGNRSRSGSKRTSPSLPAPSSTSGGSRSRTPRTRISRRCSAMGSRTRLGWATPSISTRTPAPSPRRSRAP